MKTEILGHIWNKDITIEETELNFGATYAVLGKGEDSYVQFCSEVIGDNNIELRVPAEWLKPEILKILLDD